VEVQLPGRFQWVPPGATTPGWVLDVAHNPDAARVLARNLRAHPISGKTLGVCGILADKDAKGIASTLDPYIQTWWCASVEGSRGRSGEDLAAAIREEVAGAVHGADSVAAA